MVHRGRANKGGAMVILLFLLLGVLWADPVAADSADAEEVRAEMHVTASVSGEETVPNTPDPYPDPTDTVPNSDPASGEIPENTPSSSAKNVDGPVKTGDDGTSAGRMAGLLFLAGTALVVLVWARSRK